METTRRAVVGGLVAAMTLWAGAATAQGRLMAEPREAWSPQNRLQNAALDVWFDGSPVGWVPVVTVTAIQEGTGAACHSGSCAGIGDGDRLYQDVPVRAGERLTLDGWLQSYCQAGVTGSVSLQNHQTGNYLDSVGAWVPGEAAIFTSCGDAHAGSYVHRARSFRVEDCAAGCMLRLTFSSTGTAALFDDWFLGR